MGQADGGYDTSRVTAAPADVAARDDRRVNARGNLAAMVCTTWGVGFDRDTTASPNVQAAATEFRELAEILGLDGAERAPGTCPGCGTPRPMSAARQTYACRGCADDTTWGR